VCRSPLNHTERGDDEKRIDEENAMREILSSGVDFLNHFGQLFCDFAGMMLVQVTILVLVLLAIEFILRNRIRAVVRYWLWLLVLVKLVLPVGLRTPASLAYWLPTARPQSADAAASSHASATSNSPSAQFSGQPDAFDRAASTTEQSRTEFIPFDGRHDRQDAAPTARSAPAPQPELEMPRLQLRGALFGLWILGVLSLLTLVARRAMWARRLVRQATNAPSELHEQLGDCLSAMGFSNRHVNLKTSDRLGSPAICGLWRPTILLPSGFPANLDHEQIRLVFVHELVHWRRGDLAVNCCQTLLQILYFYNPAVWLANLLIRRLREQAVDETVLVALRGQPERYAATLLDIAAAPLKPLEATLRLTGVVESRRALASRIRHILARSVPRSAKLGFGGFAAIALSGVLLLPMGRPETVARANDEPSTKPKDSESNRVADGSAHSTVAAGKCKDIDGDPLPPGVIARLGTKRFRSYSLPVAMSYLADGKTLVKLTGGAWYGGLTAAAIEFWDPTSGRLLRETPIRSLPPTCGSVSIAGNAIATCRSTLADARTWTTTIEVFGLETANQKMRLELADRPTDHPQLALSPDGRTLAFGGRSLHVIDVATGKEKFDKDIFGDRVRSLAFSSDGTKLAVGGPEDTLIWNLVGDAKPITITVPHERRSTRSEVAAVAFSPDGKTVAVGCNDVGPKGVLLFDTENGQLLRSFAVPGVTQWYFRTVQFSPDGKLLAADIEDNSGNGVALWDVTTGKLVRRLFGLFGDAYFLAFSPDSRQLAAAGERRATMCVWNLETGAPFGADLLGHVQPADTIRFSSDDRGLVTAGDDYTIRVWNLADSRQERVMQHVREPGTYDSMIRGMDLSPDGKYIVSSSFDESVRLWERATGREVYRLPGHGHSGGHRAVRFTPDSKQFASWGDDMRVYLWDVATGKAVKEFVAKPAGVVAWSPFDDRPPPSSPGSRAPLEGACFSSDASVLHLIMGNIRRFSVRTGEELPRIECPAGTASRVAVSPDNRYVLWNAHGKTEIVFPKDGSGIRAVTKSHPVELRSLPDGKIVTKLDLPGTWDDVMTFSPDSSLVALMVVDGHCRIELRKIPDLSEFARIELPSRAWALEFSHSGKLLAASDSNSTVLVWDLDHLPPPKNQESPKD
jgi:WD40 repeat protein/beta-lactamase regulating signal transducer with metallopeptidase domain